MADDVELIPDDLDALVTAVTAAFRDQADAHQLLRRIGYPLDRASNFAVDHRYAWTAVVGDLAGGVVETPYRRLITEAYDKRPYNPTFSRLRARYLLASVAHVMVVGASPDGAERVRGDRELKLVQESGLRVSPVLAAAAADLSGIGTVRPDVLHLACHCDGTNLIFETAAGMVEPVAATRVVDLLTTYRKQGGVTLRAVVLNACHSGGIAGLFTSVADTVIAHDGELDDECAAEFAGLLYRQLPGASSIAAAAHLAAAAAALTSTYCADLEQDLVVLPDS